MRILRRQGCAASSVAARATLPVIAQQRPGSAPAFCAPRWVLLGSRCLNKEVARLWVLVPMPPWGDVTKGTLHAEPSLVAAYNLRLVLSAAVWSRFSGLSQQPVLALPAARPHGA